MSEGAAGSARMVDWDLAVRVGSRLVGEGPRVVAARGRRRGRRAARPAPTARPQLVRDFTGLVATERTAPVLVVDRPGWIQANADGFATIMGPLLDKLTEKKGAARAGLTQAIGSRVTGVEVGTMLGFLGLQGARPVRPVPRPARRAGAAAARRAQHRPRRARARRRPARLPALGVPARGDPPGAVHRRAVDDRAPPVADGRDPLLGADRPGRARRRPGPQARRRARRPLRREPARPVRQPRAEGRDRPGDRRDEPARGPRRRRHGRGRAPR